MSKSLESALHNLVRQGVVASDISYCGITKNGYQIPVILHKGAYDFSGDCTRILVIGGVNGTDGEVQLALDVIETITNNSNGFNALSISYIPCLNYDAYIGNLQAPETRTKLTHGFPPDGNYFFDPEIPESRYIWRWISYQAPDLVIELSLGESIRIEPNEAAPLLSLIWIRRSPVSDDSLIGALGRKHESNPGSIPGSQDHRRKRASCIKDSRVIAQSGRFQRHRSIFLQPRRSRNSQTEGPNRARGE